MKTELIERLTSTFSERTRSRRRTELEYWLARDLQHLLGYTKWDNFLNVIVKARIACEVSDTRSWTILPTSGKWSTWAPGSQREIDDIMLTRYACYLCAAQNRGPEEAGNCLCPDVFCPPDAPGGTGRTTPLEAERVSARKKLTETEKELSADLRANRRQQELCPDPQQGGSALVWQVDSGDEARSGRPPLPARSRSAATHRSQLNRTVLSSTARKSCGCFCRPSSSSGLTTGRTKTG